MKNITTVIGAASAESQYQTGRLENKIASMVGLSGIV
jgi:hypothetical protein